MSEKIKILNLYAGIGGNRKLWTDVEVTNVEFNPKIAILRNMVNPKLGLHIFKEAFKIRQETLL